ncbi:uncharacterized protein LOC124115363 [Haliotis rufescens]|uniref:uncharacterized protein LOC124115363 n=1 Tax=Haliotis rufescens TaxID=6454 RepID=UPI00201F684C|nr:uncharacterized protein LOC124115363 [Haliotis rufescens]
MLYTFSVLVAIATLFDLTAGDPTQPENMTCVLYARRLLTCNYDLRDGIDSSNTTCTTCSQFSKNDTCPDVVTGKRCNTAVGRCEYNCDDLKFCDNFHKMKITMKGGKDAWTESMCRQIKTTDYIQPGPVRALRVTAINSTALRVSWKKPDDRHPYFETYKYSVLYLNHVKKVKTKDEDVEVVLTDLQPWTNYTVTVRSRPHRKGFRGPPQNATNATLEDVPASGPVIPESAYSRVAPGVLEVYWSSVPRDASRGVIVNYSVQATCCLSQPLYTTDHSTTVNITGHSNLTVLVNAATRNGWSAHPSQLHVNRRDLDVQYVDTVHKVNHRLEWAYIAGRRNLNNVFVSWCFGYQNDSFPQLVKCMNAIQKKLVQGGRRSIAIKNLDPLRVSCSRCEWQYAVSHYVDSVRSKLVWNTPTKLTVVHENMPMLAVLIVLIVIVAVIFIAGLAIVVRLYNRNSLCKRFTITMPRLVQFTVDDEVSISVEQRLQPDEAGLLLNNPGDTNTDNNKAHRGDTGKFITPDSIPHVLQLSNHPRQDCSDVFGNIEMDVSLPGLQVLPEELSSAPEAPWLQDGSHGDEHTETWSCSSDSGMSTYRQVTLDSAKPETQEHYSRIVFIDTKDECHQDAFGTGTQSNRTREIISLLPTYTESPSQVNTHSELTQAQAGHADPPPCVQLPP